MKGESTEYMSKNIAVFNNTTGVAESMKSLFAGEGLSMIKAASLNELLLLIKHDNIHLILMDLELEGGGLGYGIEIIQLIRRCTVIPVIVISAQTAETAKIMSLNVGADDYVTKPFNPLELVARVKSQLRRYTRLGAAVPVENDHIYETGGLSINDDLKEVRVDGDVVKLTPIEYNILLLLMKNQGRVFSINQIYESIWNEEAIGADNTVAVHIRHIREKIEINPKEPRYLKVVWGVGYKIEENK